MKLVIVFALCVVAALAAPAEKSEPVKILRSDFDQQPNGAYKFGYETEDGIQRSEDGEVREIKDEEGKPQQVVVIRGSYSYTDPEGKPVLINYYADETGFHAEGDRVPKPEGGTQPVV